MEAETASRRFGALAERRRDADLLLLHAWWRIGQLLHRGQHAAAIRLADSATGDAPSVSPTGAELARSSRATVDGIVAWHEQRLVDALPEATQLADNVEPEWLIIQALGHAEAGHRQEAMAGAARLRSVPSAGPPLPVVAAKAAHQSAEHHPDPRPSLGKASGRQVAP